ncbi:PolA DNA polymerase I - 3'-5' exonuclease and polymerase domains [uncultured Caudovirales phage]|uniref:PolA DNA polymerase I - 3'-5' exonuclease and polymerase domains n=1 Tax=uncultured Caudovirales phage TaxID=2100421 RepID=A0A6J5L5I8_9CAUD|nr:PolA DNA polymerase I - 3'-5' exonuclease and polymerase domains [uncultured Caudovirales phage]CAB5219721.1 PolA DNA polymerase I - 3'-5' exonuclease and polymerase domains [uncultured Caudovirales phage]
MNIITTAEQLSEFVEYYSKVDAFAFDVETIGEDRLYPVINDVCWISFATEGRVDVIPMGHPNGEFEEYDKPLLLEGQRRLAAGKPILDSHYSKDQRKWTAKFGEAPSQLTPAEVFKAIRPIMFSDKLKVAHNAKFDLKSVAKYFNGQVPSKPYFDTLTASFIVNNLNKNGLNLKACVQRELGVEMEKGIGENVALHSFSDVANYSGIDSALTWDLYKALSPKIVGNLQKVWKLEMDVTAALCDMELTGAYIDTEELDILSEKIGEDKEEAKAKAFRIAGEAFAINSVPAKQKLLYTAEDGKKPRLVPNAKFKNVLTTKGQEAQRAGEELLPSHYSVSAEALEYYRGKDDLVDALLEYQDLNKLMTTYVTPYTGGMVERETNGKKTLVKKESLLINGRVHTNFKSHGAETGRFSSSEPNLQNIPSSGDYGKLVRNLFVAPPGHKLVVADYSQIEPRVIASFSDDPVLIENYVTGGDIYTTIGDRMGVDRKAGKVLVLAISYGVGPDKIAASIGCSLQEAKDLLRRFEKEFSSIAKYKARIIRMAKEITPVPYIETLFGRRRYIPDLLSRDQGLLARAERQAFNTMIQGSAADLMKLALVRAHSCFTDEPDINVILTVHDELVTITPIDRAEETAEAIRQSMEGITLKAMRVPLIADVKIVDKWGEAK